MNIFHFNLLFSAWRSRSVTISLVFALAMQGIWAGVYLRDFFRSVGYFWLQVWILPFVVVWFFAKYEQKLLPHEKVRKWISLSLIIGSLIFGGALARLSEDPMKKEARVAAVKQSKTNAFERLGTKGKSR